MKPRLRIHLLITKRNDEWWLVTSANPQEGIKGAEYSKSSDQNKWGQVLNFTSGLVAGMSIVRPDQFSCERWFTYGRVLFFIFPPNNSAWSVTHIPCEEVYQGRMHEMFGLSRKAPPLRSPERHSEVVVRQAWRGAWYCWPISALHSTLSGSHTLLSASPRSCRTVNFLRLYAFSSAQ